MSGVNIPVDSTHLSDQDHAEMIEQYGGAVDSQFAKASMMRQFFNIDSIRGTDTKIVRRVGKTQLQKLTPGVRPAANKTNFGRTGVTVDTVVLARDNRSMLNEFQVDFNARAELGKDHGKELGKFFDEAFLIQGIKGAHMAAPTGLNGAIGAGITKDLAAAGDEDDPDLLYEKIAQALVDMEEADQDIESYAIFLRPRRYEVLLNHDKLIDRDFSTDNGDFADGTIKTIKGVPLMKTPRMPTAAITNHYLSNAENSMAYDLSATEARSVALIMAPTSLLAGETIPLQSEVYYSQIEKQWFIDSFLAFGVANRRPDQCAVVRKAA